MLRALTVGVGLNYEQLRSALAEANVDRRGAMFQNPALDFCTGLSLVISDRAHTVCTETLYVTLVILR